jgi:hypothetical protein
VVRAREKTEQKHEKVASPGVTDPDVALSPTITTLAGHVVLHPTVTYRHKMGYVLFAHYFV